MELELRTKCNALFEQCVFPNLLIKYQDPKVLKIAEKLEPYVL
jgi:hypothetical protein